MSKEKIKITVTAKGKEIRAVDPSLLVINICVKREPDGKKGKGGVWPETFGSPHDAAVFMKGLKIAFAMLGRLDIHLPELPDKQFG